MGDADPGGAPGRREPQSQIASATAHRCICSESTAKPRLWVELPQPTRPPQRCWRKPITYRHLVGPTGGPKHLHGAGSMYHETVNFMAAIIATNPPPSRTLPLRCFGSKWRALAAPANGGARPTAEALGLTSPLSHHLLIFRDLFLSQAAEFFCAGARNCRIRRASTMVTNLRDKTAEFSCGCRNARHALASRQPLQCGRADRK